jgi:hypothetical protein
MISDKFGKENDIEHGNIELFINEEYGLDTKVTKDKKNIFNNKFIRGMINGSYMFFVLSSILWAFLYAIGLSIIEKDSRYVTSNIFLIMYIVQYITGVLFYRKNFYNESIKKMNNYHKKLIISYIVSIVISCIISILSVIFLINGFNMNIYTKMYDYIGNDYKIIVCILIIIDKFYSYNIYFVNVITFSFSLINQRIKIGAFKNKLDSIVSGNNDIKINEIIMEYTELKSYHSILVNSLNNVFVSITILGLGGCYFTVMDFNTEFIGVITYIDIIFYIIVEGIYIYSINRIKYILDDIRRIVESTPFAFKFLGKSELTSISGDIYEDYNSAKIESENNLDDIEIESMLSPATTPIKSRKNSNLETSSRYVNMKIIHESIAKKDIDGNRKIDLIKNIMFRNLIVTHENGIDIQWVLLYNKLSEPWDQFSIFGFDMDDDQLIQKFIFVGLSFFGILRLNDKFIYN